LAFFGRFWLFPNKYGKKTEKKAKTEKYETFLPNIKESNSNQKTRI
jgi:hypothetical protein